MSILGPDASRPRCGWSMPQMQTILQHDGPNHLGLPLPPAIRQPLPDRLARAGPGQPIRALLATCRPYAAPRAFPTPPLPPSSPCPPSLPPSLPALRLSSLPPSLHFPRIPSSAAAVNSGSCLCLSPLRAESAIGTTLTGLQSRNYVPRPTPPQPRPWRPCVPDATRRAQVARPRNAGRLAIVVCMAVVAGRAHGRAQPVSPNGPMRTRHAVACVI